MKRIVVLALGLCVLASLTLRAADEPAKKGDRAARRAEMIKKYDKNGDGKLDEAERAAMREDQKKNREKKGDK